MRKNNLEFLLQLLTKKVNLVLLFLHIKMFEKIKGLESLFQSFGSCTMWGNSLK